MINEWVVNDMVERLRIVNDQLKRLIIMQQKHQSNWAISLRLNSLIGILTDERRELNFMLTEEFEMIELEIN